MVLLSTKSLKLPGIHKLQPCFVGSFWLLLAGHGTYCLGFLPSMVAIHPWFYTSLFEPDGLQPAGLPVLEEDSYEYEGIFQIKKRGTHAKVK